MRTKAKKTQKPEPGSLEELKQKADEVLVWKAEMHPAAPMDLKGFAYAFAGKKAADWPELYDRHATLAQLWAEGEAIWWRTIAHVKRYEAEAEAERQREANRPPSELPPTPKRRAGRAA